MSHEIRAFLHPEDVLVNVDATCKRGVLRQLATHAARSLELPVEPLLASLLEREQLGSTGLGQGIALPHARAPLDRVRGVFARLKRPIDFESVDHQPVDLLFLLLAPDDGAADHLKALSRVARAVRSAEIQRALRGATDKATVYAVLTGAADAQAA